MSDVQRTNLRVVGGNDKLIAMKQLSQQTRWPPLRVVERNDTLPPVSDPTPKQGASAKRPAGTVMGLIGLAAATIYNAGLAIADHYS